MNYEQNKSKLGTFNTINDFWRYYNNYPYPSSIFSDGSNKPIIEDPDREVASISLFKLGTEPKWEDPNNTNGAEIAIRKFKNLEELDSLWETISMLCIGEQFEMSELITGIRIVDSSIPNRKALYRIELWFSDKKYKDVIENSFKNKLNLGPLVQLHHKEHSTAVESIHNKYQDKKNGKFKRY
jgi:translation initiation factor 4E